MLEDMKLLLGITSADKDELLELLIRQATNYAKMYAGLQDTTPALKTCIVKMAIYDYNRLGTEGLNSESYSGTSYNYTDGYPQEIMTFLESCKTNLGEIKILW